MELHIVACNKHAGCGTTTLKTFRIEELVLLWLHVPEACPVCRQVSLGFGDLGR